MECPWQKSCPPVRLRSSTVEHTSHLSYRNAIATSTGNPQSEADRESLGAGGTYVALDKFYLLSPPTGACCSNIGVTHANLNEDLCCARCAHPGRPLWTLSPLEITCAGPHYNQVHIQSSNFGADLGQTLLPAEISAF